MSTCCCLSEECSLYATHLQSKLYCTNYIFGLMMVHIIAPLRRAESSEVAELFSQWSKQMGIKQKNVEHDSRHQEGNHSGGLTCR